MKPSHTLSRLLPMLGLLLAAGMIHAQPSATPNFVNGPVGLTPDQASVFKAALAALARQGHTCIVAEGAPLRPTLKPDKAPAVPDHTPLEIAVKLVADAYDYDEERRGNVFLLTKRYTDPADLPSVTLDECTHDLEYITNLLAAFNPPEPSGPTHDSMWNELYAVIGSYSSEQMRALLGPGLPVSSLSPDQRAAAQGWVQSIRMSYPLELTRHCLDSLRHAPQTQVGLGSLALGSQGKATVFGRRWPDAGGSFVFIGFDQDTPIMGGRGVDPNGGTTTREEREAARTRRDGARTDGGETLAQAVAALNRRGARFQVQDELAAKMVIVAGGDNATPEAVLDGLAGVYGLRVYRRDDGVTELTHVERVTPVDVAALPDAVRRALPAPLLRVAHVADTGAGPLDTQIAALRQRLQDLLSHYQPGADFHAQFAALIEEQRDLFKRQDNHRRAADTAHRAAVRALRAATELYPASVKVDGLVPVSAMTEQDQEAYATADMADLLGRIKPALAPQSVDPVLKLNQYVLTAKIYQREDVRGRWKIDLYLNRLTPEGRLETEMGEGEVAYQGQLPDGMQ
ncbi:MAG: hypothetical protein JO250_12490 [Armatimonadetes bacterium]|nr:hypothetical protein [Armatimonadota bacterium]